MGKKTSLTIKLLAASLFTMLAVAFLFTDSIGLVSFGDAESVELDDVADGTYAGTATGHNAPLDVEVTVEGGEIVAVTVLNHEETDGLADPALEGIPEAIVDSNSTEVEVVSGATITSEAIVTAVNTALAGEPGEPSEVVSVDEEDEEEEEEVFEPVVRGVEYVDGTYEGTTDGAHGPLSVEVTITDGNITEVVVTEQEENEEIAPPALEGIPEAMVDENSTQVEVVSGATVTSGAIMAAADNALLEASLVYQATVEGHNGPMTVEVALEEGTITRVEVIEHDETEGLADPALEETPATIVENNSTEVDTVSGATISSEAIIEAVNLVLDVVNN